MANPNIWAPGTALDANSSIKIESFTASADQTVFTLTDFQYALGTGALWVFVSGVFQRPGIDFTETSVTSFTLDTPVAEGTVVIAAGFVETTAVQFTVDNLPYIDNPIITGGQLNNATVTDCILVDPVIAGAPTAAGATWADLGTVTTVDVNGGAINNSVIGATTPADGTFNTLIAKAQLYCHGAGEITSNSTFGLRALDSNTTGAENTAVGTDALTANTTGINNTAIGTESLRDNLTGQSNVAVGYDALLVNTAGHQNVAVGRDALINYTGNDAVAIGMSAAANMVSYPAVAIGSGALYSSTEPFNTAVGTYALYSTSTGEANTGVGYHALFTNTLGDNNTAVGATSGEDITTGSNNVTVGYAAGRGITTGSGNTVLGANLTGLAAGLTNTLVLGSGGAVRATHDGTTLAVTGGVSTTGNSAFGDAEATDTHAIKGATTILSNSASAALTVTNTGSGNSFVVEDSASTDSTPFVITAGGRNILGNTSEIAVAAISNQNWQLHGNPSLGLANTSMVTWYADAATSGIQSYARSKSNTVGTHAAVASGDEIHTIRFYGSDGTGFILAAQIKSEVDGTPGTNDMPGRLVFSTTADGASSPTEAMRIDRSQNVGIGAAAGTGKVLYINKSIAGSAGSGFCVDARPTYAAAGVTSGGYSYYSLPSTEDGSTNTLISHFYAAQGTITGGTRATPTNQYGFLAESSLTGATNNYGFYSALASGTGRWNFYAAGTASNFFGGLVDISGASAGQIKFPATQNASADANTLDDYEEGTFTPAVAFGGASTGVTYSTQSGVYTKVGRVVHFCVSIALTSNGSSTGSATVTGLPFTCTASISFVASFRAASGFSAGSLDRPLFMQVSAAGTAIAVLRVATDGATASSSLTDTEVTDTATFTISGYYTV